MKGRWILPALLLAAGCGDPGPHEDEGHEAGEEHAHDEAALPEGTIRIDPEMLRDLRITTARAESRSGGEEVSLLGELTPDENAYAEVGTPVEARVVRLLAQAGDRVRAGGALAELHSAELGRARAAVGSARARAELASQALARKRSLAAERIAPLREVEEAEAEAGMAHAELQAAEAAAAALGAGGGGGSGASLLLRSPLSGTVLTREAARGEMVSPEKTLFTIADLSRVWLVAHGFERDAVRIRTGAPATLVFAAHPGRTFTGTVALVGSAVDGSSRTIPVRIEVANTDALLRPGMSATARVPVGDAAGSVVAVPAAALQRLASSWCVFLPRPQGAFEVRPVGRGRDLGGEVEVLTGLAAGESIVVEGAFLLKAEAEKARGEGAHHEH